MSLLLRIITVTAVAGIGGTGFGGCIGALFRRSSRRIISLLLGFAGGVMLGVVCFDLLESAVREAGLGPAICGVLAGGAGTYALNLPISRAMRFRQDNASIAGHTARNSNQHFGRLITGGLVMAAAIALHNLPEGIVIGASHSAETVGAAARESLAVAAVIGLHNIPEGMAVAVPLITGGLRRRTAVFLTALTGLPTVLGALMGYLLGTVGPLWMSLALSFASGAMLYVVFGELLPESTSMWRSPAAAIAGLIGLLTGLVIIRV